jgi:hypothetical protein
MALDTKLNLSNQKFEQHTGDTLQVSGQTIIFGDFKYGVNRSGSFGPRSIPDVAWVTGITSNLEGGGGGTGSTIYNNGLERDGATVSLGGKLTKNTNIPNTGNTQFITFLGIGRVGFGTGSPASVLDIKGTTSDNSATGLIVRRGDTTISLSVRNDGLISTFGQVLLGDNISDSTPATSTRVDIRGVNGGNILRLGTHAGSNVDRLIVANTGFITHTTSGGTGVDYTLTGGLTASSGSLGKTAFRINSVYNSTSTHTGTLYGIDYNPTVTSIASGATHIAARFSSGNLILGKLTGDTTSRLSVYGVSGGRIATLRKNAGANVVTVDDSGLVTIEKTVADDAVQFMVGSTTNGFANVFNAVSQSNLLRGYGNGTTAFEIVGVSSPTASRLDAYRNNGWLMRNLGGDTGVVSVLTLGTSSVSNVIQPLTSATRDILLSTIGYTIGHATIASNVNFIRYAGTWTKNAAAAGDNLKVIAINHTISTVSGTSNAYGIDYNPTVSNSIGLTHIAARFTVGQVLLGASSAPDNSTTVTIDRGTGNVYNNLLKIRSAGSDRWTINASGELVHTSGFSALSGSNTAHRIGGTYSAGSGSGNHILFNINPTLNYTNTASGTSRAFYYNPTVSNMVSTMKHIAFENTSGEIRFGGITQDNTKNQILVREQTTNKLFWKDSASLSDSGHTLTVSSKNIGGSVLINLSTANMFLLTVTGNVTTFNYTGETVGKQYIFKFLKDTTEKTFTWASGRYRFPFGNAPVLTNPTTNGSNPVHSEDIVTALCTTFGRLDIVITPDLIAN